MKKTTVRLVEKIEKIVPQKPDTIIKLLSPKTFWELLECQWDEWLDRFCQWWLRKRGRLQPKTNFEIKISSQKIELDQKKIIDSCLKQIVAIRNRYDLKSYPETILIGTSQLHSIDRQLMQRCTTIYLDDFDIMSPKGKLERVTGMKVIIIPWMDGILPIPDLNILE